LSAEIRVDIEARNTAPSLLSETFNESNYQSNTRTFDDIGYFSTFFGGKNGEKFGKIRKIPIVNNVDACKEVCM